MRLTDLLDFAWQVVRGYRGRTFLILLVLVCACDRDGPTKPRSSLVGTGFVFSSIRDLYYREIYKFYPTWSSDGSHIAFTDADLAIWTMATDGSDLTRVSPHLEGITSATGGSEPRRPPD